MPATKLSKGRHAQEIRDKEHKNIEILRRIAASFFIIYDILSCVF